MKTVLEWSALPCEVKQLILLRLPLPDLFRLRAVSRSWNALLSSNAFLQLWSSSASAHHSYWLKGGFAPLPFNSSAGHGGPVLPRCCGRPVQQQPSVLCLCSRTRKDFALPVPRKRFHPQMLREAMDVQLQGAVSASIPCHCIFAAGGGSLVAELAFYCATQVPRRPEVGKDKFLLRLFLSNLTPAIRVFNVVTGLSRQLPLPLISICSVSPSTFALIPGFFEGTHASTHCLLEPRTMRGRNKGNFDLRLLVSDDDMHYHLVIQIPAKAVLLLVYESRCPGSWRVVHGMPYERNPYQNEAVWEFPQAAFQGHDIYEGDLFFPVVSKGFMFGYRVETDEWSKISVTSGFPEECYNRGPTVMKVKGPRILMAVPLSCYYDGRCILDGFSLWELKKCSLQSIDPCAQVESYLWAEVARTPESLSSEYDYVDDLHFVHGNGMICMTGTCYNLNDFSNDEDAIPNRCVSPPVYDLVQGRWFLMPFDWMNSRSESLILSSMQPSFPGAVP